MKTQRLVLLFAAAALAALPSAHAQSRNNFFENIRRMVVRAPLNTNTVVTRTTPAGGTVTVATTNTFNGTSGTFDTDVTMPNGNTASVSGTISITPGTGATVTGSITGPGGNTTTFTNTAMPTNTGVTLTSTVTPPSGNIMTRTTTLTPPDDANADDEDGMLARLMKRLRMPGPPRG